MIASAANYIGDESGNLKIEANRLLKSITDSPTWDIKSAFGPTAFTLFTVLIMPVYVFFLLFYRNKFKQ